MKTSPAAPGTEAKDARFRREVAEEIRLGFELPIPKTVEVVLSVPNVPRFQKTEVTASI